LLKIEEGDHEWGGCKDLEVEERNLFLRYYSDIHVDRLKKTSVRMGENETRYTWNSNL
jgi:hypothetical protein